MSRQTFVEIQKDPSSIYMHSTVGKALSDTICDIRGATTFAHLSDSQKKLIIESMTKSMKKEELFSNTMDKLSAVVKGRRDAVNIESTLNSMEIKGKIREYSVISGTMRLSLEDAQITINTYETISVESDRLPLNIIATETKKKYKKSPLVPAKRKSW